MKRYHFLPWLRPQGITYEIEVLANSRPNYEKTTIAWNSVLTYLQKKWFRRFPFRVFEPWMSWEVWANALQTRYFMWTPGTQEGLQVLYRLIIENLDLHIKYADDIPLPDFTRPHAGMKLMLAKNYSLPLAIHQDHLFDTQSALLEFLSNLSEGQELYVQFLIRPQYESKVHRSFRKAQQNATTDQQRAIQEKGRQIKAEVAINLLGMAETEMEAVRLVEDGAKALRFMNTRHLNRLRERDWWRIFRPLFRFTFPRRVFPLRWRREAMILGGQELSGLIRAPSIAGTTKYKRIQGKRMLIPVEVAELATRKDSIYLGNCRRNIGNVPIHLPLDGLKGHMAVLGGAQAGKSRFIQNALLQFLQHRSEKQLFGCTVIDTEGDLVEGLVHRLPESLADQLQVVHFQEGRIPFNLFELDFHKSHYQRAKIVADTLYRMDPNHWTPMVAEYFLYGGMALQKLGMANLQNLQRLIEDQPFRKQVIAKLQEEGIEPSIVRFLQLYELEEDWRNAFLLSPILNRLRQLNTSSLSRMINQPNSQIRFQEALEQGKLLLFDLSGLDPTEKRFIGTALLTQFQYGMGSRIDRTSAALHPLVIDDATHLLSQAVDDWEQLALEARRYHTPLIMSVSALQQKLTDQRIETLFRQFDTLVSFQMGNAQDAQRVWSGLNSWGLQPRDFHVIEPGFGYIQMMVNGRRTWAFTIKGPDLTGSSDRKEAKNQLQSRYP